MNSQLLRHDRRYRRLKVGGRTWTGRSIYWLGDDHLLVVNMDHFTESYRRFYHRDLRWLIIRRTRVWEISLGLGGLMLLATGVPAGLMALNPGNLVGFVILGSLAALLLIFMVIEGLGGPTCSVQISTGHQGRDLPGVRRLRAANLLVRELEPRILAAQAPGEAQPPSPAHGPEAASTTPNAPQEESIP